MHCGTGGLGVAVAPAAGRLTKYALEVLLARLFELTVLRELFSEQLPLGLVRWIIPMAIYDDEGNRIPNEKIENSAKKGGYGIAWPVSQIQLR